MTEAEQPSIRIAAGLIVDHAGRVLLVRKRGTQTFMQAGGKIEPHESPVEALAREIAEELGVRVTPQTAEYLGEFTAQAANETQHIVKAACFYIRADLTVTPAAEIEEAVWVAPTDTSLPLAPLTRDHLLPIARRKLRDAGFERSAEPGLDAGTKRSGLLRPFPFIPKQLRPGGHLIAPSLIPLIVVLMADGERSYERNRRYSDCL
jgi:8-oxo-dGTP diphosphatase